VQYHFGESKKSSNHGSLRGDAQLFRLALNSYPELFLRQPSVTFEQHFLSLIVAAQNHSHSTDTAAR
jgi:hypothetical protein